MAGVGVGGGSPLLRSALHGPQAGEVPPLGAGPSVDTLRFVASIKVRRRRRVASGVSVGYQGGVCVCAHLSIHPSACDTV